MELFQTTLDKWIDGEKIVLKKEEVQRVIEGLQEFIQRLGYDSLTDLVSHRKDKMYYEFADEVLSSRLYHEDFKHNNISFYIEDFKIARSIVKKKK